ncbi:serine/threonine protein kinase [Sporanaerobacter acetigenes DSM 13106]|uniref:non-specific serine/threonine protein kinase n=2 Tax=Sporanaerobacter acetigenes TaxID=165813 RepID=A0A1M5XWY9_9FIRM|nr:serine/threonine protein kinase [Sporanaerobacter acetigenes DSM 13106]
MNWGDKMIGKVLGGRYEIIEKIGGGGMAVVYKARCRLLNRYVAVKVLREEFINDEEFINKFRRESQAAASLSHPNIVSIYDVGMEDDIYYIVMEYIDGKTLKEVIDEKGKLTAKETIEYSIQIAEALEHAHRNHIVHRDIKPHNIMVTRDGRIKVTDFGIARAANASTMTNTSTVIGSVHYFSPEQARGRFTDEKSDIYSLGIVMYEMITGKVPFEGESPISVALKHIQEEIVPPTEIDSSVPKNIEYIIMKCVRKNQNERYQNASELLKDLRKVKYSKEDMNFVDNIDTLDSATRIIPIVKDEGENEEMKTKPKKKKSNKGSNNGGKRVIFWAVFLAFLLTTGLAFGIYKFKDGFSSKEIEVPDIVGWDVDKAREEIEGMGLKFEVEDTVYSSEFEENKIVYQSKEPGTVVKKNYPIKVKVSKGGKLVKVPNLINKDINEASLLLKERSLDEDVEFRNDDKIPINIVISQDPEPYEEVKEGTKVKLVVSQGPEKKMTIMPKLVGMKENEAKRAIVANRLVLGKADPQFSDEVPKGTVIWQSYESGTELEENTVVDIYVSDGPEKKKDEEKSNENQNEEIPMNLSISLPQDRSQTEVKVFRIQDGVTEQVYNQVHNVTEENLIIPVKGKPNAKFDVYFDGNFYDTYGKQ